MHNPKKLLCLKVNLIMVLRMASLNLMISFLFPPNVIGNMLLD